MGTGERPLTDMQVFALFCIERGAVRGMRVTRGWRVFTRYHGFDSDITTQVASLRRRGLAKYVGRGVLGLTPAGTEALAAARSIRPQLWLPRPSR